MLSDNRSPVAVVADPGDGGEFTAGAIQSRAADVVESADRGGDCRVWGVGFGEFGLGLLPVISDTTSQQENLREVSP